MQYQCAKCGALTGDVQTPPAFCSRCGHEPGKTRPSGTPALQAGPPAAAPPAAPSPTSWQQSGGLPWAPPPQAASISPYRFQQPVPQVEQVGKAGRVLMTVLLALTVVGALLTLAYMGQLSEILDKGAEPDVAVGTMAAYIASSVLDYVTIGVQIAFIIVFCIWLYRMGAHAAARNPQVSPGWMVGSLFIPFANFVMPYFAIRKAWRTTGTGTDTPLAAWFWTWSGSMIAGVLIAGFVFVRAMMAVIEAFGSNDTSDFMAGTSNFIQESMWADLALTVVNVAAGILLIKFIQTWTRVVLAPTAR